MKKKLHPLTTVGLNHSGKDKQFLPHFTGRNDVSTLRFKLNYVSKRGPIWWRISPDLWLHNLMDSCHDGGQYKTLSHLAQQRKINYGLQSVVSTRHESYNHLPYQRTYDRKLKQERPAE